jgi:hypothetical protein
MQKRQHIFRKRKTPFGKKLCGTFLAGEIASGRREREKAGLPGYQKIKGNQSGKEINL